MTPFRLCTTTLLLSTALVLAGCEDGVPTDLPGFGGGGAGGTVVTPASFRGIWEGGYVGNPPGEPEQWESTFIGLAFDGRMIMLDSSGQVWDGDYEVTGPGSMRMSDVSVYQRNGLRATRIIVNGNITSGNVLDMMFDLGTGVGMIQQQHSRNDIYLDGSSLDRIAGVWSDNLDNPALTLAINDLGDRAEFDGVRNDCHYSGVIELLDPEANLYDVSEFVVTDGVEGACDIIIDIREVDVESNEPVIVPTPFPFAGDEYTGLATLMPDDNTLVLIVSKPIAGAARSVTMELVR